MMKLRREAAIPVWLTIAVACGGAEADWAGTMTDSAGVVIVDNPVEGIWTEGQQWQVEEQLTIGAADGDPDYQFGQISGIGISSDGRIFVLDQQAAEVRVFSQSGEFLSGFGGQGSGPGELRGIGSGPLLVASEDRIFVPDLGNQRVQIYSSDGVDLGSHPFEVQNGMPVRWSATETGTIAMQLRQFAIPGQPGQPDTMDTVLELNADGTIADTLMRFPQGRTVNFGPRGPQTTLFAAEPFWALAGDDQILQGINDEYRIGVYGRDGILERIITKPFERQPVTEEDQEIMLEAIAEFAISMGAPAAQMARLRDVMQFAENFPAYLQFLSGPSQSVWVQRILPPSQLSEDQRGDLNPQLGGGLTSPDWDIFDVEGRYLGLVTMPDKFQPVSFNGTDIYGVWRDDLDVQYVVKVRLITGGDDAGIPMAGGE